MITNPKLLQKAEDDFIRKNKMTIRQKYKMLDEMYGYACSLNINFPEDPLGNLNAIVELARKIHSVPQVNIEDNN